MGQPRNGTSRSIFPRISLPCACIRLVFGFVGYGAKRKENKKSPVSGAVVEPEDEDDGDHQPILYVVAIRTQLRTSHIFASFPLLKTLDPKVAPHNWLIQQACHVERRYKYGHR